MWCQVIVIINAAVSSILQAINSILKLVVGYSFHSGWISHKRQAEADGRFVHRCDILWKTSDISSFNLFGQYYTFFQRHRFAVITHCINDRCF